MSEVSDLEKEFERVQDEAMDLNQQIVDLREEEENSGRSHYDAIVELQEEYNRKEDELTLIGRQMYGHAAVEMSK